MSNCNSDAIASAALEVIDSPLVVLAADLRVEVANKAFLKQFELSRDETLGRSLCSVGNGQWDCPELRQLLRCILDCDVSNANCRVQHQSQRFGRRVLRLDAKRVQPPGTGLSILLSVSVVPEHHGLTVETVKSQVEEALRASGASAQAREIETIYASAHVGLCVLDRELRFRRINSRLAEINGLSVADHIGRSVREILPDLADMAEPIAKQIFSTGEPMLDLEISGETPAQPGVRRTWVEQWLPLRDETGAIIGINIAAEEVTERKRAEQRLQAAHDTFRSLVDHSPFGIYVVDAEFRLMHVSDGARKSIEHIQPNIGRDFSEVVRTNWPEPFASEVIGRFQHTLATGERYRSPRTVERRADTAVVEAYDWQIERISLPDGRQGVVCHFYDLSELLRKEEQLAVAAERAELAQQAVLAMYYEFVPSTGISIRSHSAFEALTGYPNNKEFTTGAWWRSIIHPEDAERAWTEIENGIANGTGFKLDYRICHAQGHDVWVHDHARIIPAHDEKAARVVGMVLDISEQKEREAREQLLLREVNHRAKNMLGLVQAVARQTAAGDPEKFVERFGDRIQSLAASQDLLVKSNWKNVPLESLVHSQLGHFSDLVGARILVSGPILEISPYAAQALGMALHELATNAAKHGALSNKTGSVSVGWEIFPLVKTKLVFLFTGRKTAARRSLSPPAAASARGSSATWSRQASMVRLNSTSPAADSFGGSPARRMTCLNLVAEFALQQRAGRRSRRRAPPHSVCSWLRTMRSLPSSWQIC